MNTRIAHILSSFGIGGQERVAFDLAVSQRRAGCQVTALSLAPPPDGPLAAELVAAGIAVELTAWRVSPGPGIDPIADHCGSRAGCAATASSWSTPTTGWR